MRKPLKISPRDRLQCITKNYISITTISRLLHSTRSLKAVHCTHSPTQMKRMNPLLTNKGSNPSPGAYFEEPNTSLKAFAGGSRVEVATTNMDELTESETKQKKQKMMI